MRIVTFWRNHEVRLGILIGEKILDAALAAPLLPQGQEWYFHDALSFIRGATQR